MNLREWALPVYTILMQIATGILFMLWIIRHQAIKHRRREEISRMVDTPLTIALFTIVVGMIGAHFHLSKPYLSLLALLNIKSSWLSREIAFTILFFFTTGGLWYLRRRGILSERAETSLGWSAIFFGVATIYCMARIYLLPTQIAWNSPATISYYLGTTFLLGAMAMAVLLIMDLRFTEVRETESPTDRIPIIQASLSWLAILAVVMVFVVIGINIYQISLLQTGEASAATSLSLIMGIYRPLFITRIGLVALGVSWFIYSTYLLVRKHRNIHELMTPIYGSCLLVMIGEILGRFIFYATHVRIGI